MDGLLVGRNSMELIFLKYVEKLSGDSVETSEFSAKILNILKENHLHSKQVNNINETGINFKLLPYKIFATAQEKLVQRDLKQIKKD